MSGTDPRRWHEIKALFQEAIDLRPDERERFLARACGDDLALRAEVESLLVSHDDERPFLDGQAIAGGVQAVAVGADGTGKPWADLVPGATIGQYEVLERLGAGGMGEVYRARDTKLDRFVALKIVNDSVATGRPADRVLREARAASALNHPNVCTVYEVGEFDGRPYLAMEYVAGRSLSSAVPPGGLQPEDVVKYGVQIGDALAHAHDQGVIHRDLKSANVVVNLQGRAKVLDFGLARRVAAVDAGPKSGTLTQAGTIAGTLACMAPELLRDQKADVRSDIWAFGVLLYEMASGRRPFVGETAFEVTSSILKDAPSPLPSRLPAALRSVIFRCLARSPDDRFQRASDVVSALDTVGRSISGVRSRWLGVRRISRSLAAAAALIVLGGIAYQRGWLAGEPVPTQASVAVVPFRILSGAQEFAFLGVGLPDAIISRLALVSGMRVPPTNAVLTWEKEPVDPQSAGRKLGVDYVLTGEVETAGDKIRVTPQLFRVADGSAIWTRPYELSSAELPGLQNEIAKAVVGALEIQMSRADRARVDRQYTRDPEAYGLYARGRSELAERNPESTAAAARSFEAALARDKNYALAHAGFAIAAARMGLFYAPEREVAAWQTRAQRAAQRAVQLDPTLAEAHEAQAAVYRHAEFDWNDAIEESARALTLNPNLDEPHLYRASAFSHLGLLDRVPAEATAALEMNPKNEVESLRVRGVSAMFAGRFDEAVALLQKARPKDPFSAEWNLANAYYYAGQQREAESMLRSLRGPARSERRGQATLASFLAARRQSDEAIKLIDVVTGGSYMDHHVAYALGAAYAQLGLHSEAIRWLRDAWSRGFRCYPWFERDPLLAPLKSTAGFHQLLGDLKGSWEITAARHQARR